MKQVSLGYVVNTPKITLTLPPKGPVHAPLPVSGESKLPTVKLVAETSVVFDGSGNRVCLVRNRAMTNAETDALAKLFAASHDLLDALKPIAFFTGDLREWQQRDRLVEMMATARAAIEKATK